VGNYVRGKITLIKDYGIILEIADGVNGFILNENLKHDYVKKIN
jgi:predicted RNA-binding protein with RPS1 domain